MNNLNYVNSGGSRISPRGVDPLGGLDLRRGRFSIKMHAKTKELGPVGGGVRRKFLYVDPPLVKVTLCTGHSSFRKHLPTKVGLKVLCLKLVKSKSINILIIQRNLTRLYKHDRKICYSVVRSTFTDVDLSP